MASTTTDGAEMSSVVSVASPSVGVMMMVQPSGGRTEGGGDGDDSMLGTGGNMASSSC